MPEVDALFRIADNCHRIREKKPCNIMELSRRSGLSPSTIHRIFSGSAGTSLTALQTLADYWGIDISEFFKQGEK